MKRRATTPEQRMVRPKIKPLKLLVSWLVSAAARPYEIVVLSDHGQTQGATFKQRNGYGLEDLVERSLAPGEVTGFAGWDEQNSMVGLAVGEATTDSAKKRPWRQQLQTAS